MHKKIAKSQKKLKMIILILKNKGSCIQIRRLNTEYDLNTERQTRLKILPQKWTGLRKQVVSIKQTIEKVLDENKSFLKRTCTLFCGQGITIMSIFTALSMTISTITLVVTDVFFVFRVISTKRQRSFDKIGK